jgi:hypothetical protein
LKDILKMQLDIDLLSQGLSTDPYPHILIENYVEKGLMDQVLTELQAIEPSLRQPQIGNASKGYDPTKSEYFNDCPASQELGNHLGSAEFFNALADILCPFSTGRLAISQEELRGQVNDPMRRSSFIKANGTGNGYKIRQAHVDGAVTAFAFLLYLRLPNDYSVGGNLHMLMQEKGDRGLRAKVSDMFGWELKLVKSVEYRPNTLIAFINGSDSWHEVSPRNNAEVARLSFQGGLLSDRELFTVKTTKIQKIFAGITKVRKLIK